MKTFFTRRIIGVLLPALFIGAAVAKAQTSPVTVEEKTMEIPTYLLGQEDPNPPFQLVASNAVYPYTMLEDLTDHREMKTYKAIILENQYLRATILPELGARLYSLYDKVNKREVFYHNESVKYGLIGLRGAWISGGIEFNFPNGHTTDTVSPVSSRYQKNADGSATVLVGDVDQVSEMYWQVALTLRPGAGRLEQHITLFNPTSVEKLYWYWNNAAIPATEDMHFIYPMREVNPDSLTEFWSFPIWKGIDYSQYKNIRGPTELFGVQIHRNFFGAYYTKSNDGVVHFADYREDTGKKLWSWGVAGNGAIWTKLLTDKDGPYNEIQSGRFETQLNQDFMPPQVVESWKEYWYPVQQLNGGFVEATKQFAINVKILPTTQPKGEIQVFVSPTEAVKQASLVIRVDGKDIKTIGGLSFDPLVTKTFSIPVADIEAAKGKAEVEIIGASGHALLRWSAAEPIDGNPDFVSRVGIHPAPEVSDKDRSVEELFLQGVLEEKEGNWKNAQQLFDETLKRDPTYIPVLCKLATQQYRAANFPLAEKYIERAIQQDAAAPQTQYLAGVIYRAAGKTNRAQDAFWTSIRLGRPSPQALVQLGEIALERKDYPRAEHLLRQALSYSPKDVLTQSDLAAALRLSGKLPEAAKVAGGAVDAMPLYPVALAEQWRIFEAQGADLSATQSAKKMWAQAVGNRMQSYLEAGSWYWRLHDWASSDFILHASLQNFPSTKISPMVYYYLASNARQEGLTQRAVEYAAKARAARYDKIFPNRISDAIVLQEALHNDPTDAHAQYFLGNFLFQHGRYEEAEKLWLQAQASGFEYAVLDRNLGVDAWKVQHNLGEAASFYAKAIQLEPQQYRFYVALDKIYAQEGATQERAKLFAGAPSGVLDHDPARIQYILLLMQEGQFDQALSLMKDHSFKPWEKGENVHDIFVFANIQAGRQALAAKKFNLAQEDFERALEYPINLGVGKRDKPRDADAIYWLGEAMKEQGNREGADREWKQIAGRVNGSEWSRYYAALALEGLGQNKEAADAMMAQLAAGPAPGQASAENYYVAGLAERHGKQEQQANAYFRKALEVEPSFWPAQMELK